MAIDHGPQNIRVNCICPGDTDTPMLRDEAKQVGQAEEKFMAEAAADLFTAALGAVLDESPVRID